MKKAARTSDEDRIPLRKKLFYSMGSFPDMLGLYGLKSLVSPIYTIAMGVSPALVGIALSITQIWDALIDPTMGSISDKSRTRFGRRRPYIFVGALTMGAVVMVMWQLPRDISETAYFIWLLVSFFLLSTTFTIFTVPFHALGYELTPDYDERTRVMTYRILFNFIVGIYIHWMLHITQMEYFEDTVEGASFVGLLTGLIIIFFGLIPALTIRERFAKVTKQTERVSTWQSTREVLKSSPFRLLLSMTLLMSIVQGLVGSYLIYLNTFYVFDGDLGQAATLHGVTGSLGLIASLCGLAAANYLSERIDKRRTMLLSFFIQFLSGIAAWFCVSPSEPYLQVIYHLLNALASAMFYVIMQSMVSDVCDEDELRTGTRSEGMYGAYVTLAQKLAGSLSLLLVGFVLVLIGFDETPGAVQSSSTILWLRILFPGLVLAKALIGFYICLRYPLDRSTLSTIRKELESRRGIIQ